MCVTILGRDSGRARGAGAGVRMGLHGVGRRAAPGERPGRLWHCRRPRFPGDCDTALWSGETSEPGDASWLAGSADTPERTPSPLAEGDAGTVTELLPLAGGPWGFRWLAPAPGEAPRTLLPPLRCLGKGLVATFGWHRILQSESEAHRQKRSRLPN